MSVTCEICGKEFKKYGSLGNHISRTHKIKSIDYYLQYINPNEDIKCPVCGKDRKFRSLMGGFYKTCGSKKCSLKIKNKTCLDKYGVYNPSKSKKIKDKIKQTNLKRYGVDNPFKSDEVKDKIKSTCLNRYGVDNYTKTDEYKESYKKMCLKKYNTEYHFKSKKIKDKIKYTNINKYGVDSHTKTKEYKYKVKKNNLYKLLKLLSVYRPEIEYLSEMQGMYHEMHIRKWKCKKCNTIFEDYARSTHKWLHPRCPTCNPIKYTSIENKIYDFLITMLNDEDEIIRNDRQVITPYELDLYLPSLNLAIECDGKYWHSDEILLKTRNMNNEQYKIFKINLCKDNKITLLHFTEDEINNEFEKVKEKIRSFIYEKENNNSCG